MKVLLLLFMFCLISGPVSSFSVTGYSGGIVMIFCSHYGWHNRTKYFCGTSTKQCVYLDQTQNRWSHKGRVDLYDHPRGLTVIYRNLSLQDTGSYLCGETGVWSHVLNLKVNEGPCCSGRKTETVYLGKTVAISCSYPEEFKTNIKFLYKQDGKDLTEAISTTVPQRGRFSISDNRSSKVVSVRISDVREDDGGVYYCGMWNGEDSVSSFSFFKEIQLHVTVPASTTPEEVHFCSSIIIIIIITVCVCVVLLLIGGSALIFYRLRCRRTQDSGFISTQSGTNETADNDYENDPPGNQNNTSITPVYQNLNVNTNQSDSVYQSLDPGSREPNSDYYNLRTNN